MTHLLPTLIPDLVCFWDFHEPAQADRIAVGPHPYRLHEGSGPIASVPGGVFAQTAASLDLGQWFVLPRAECPALDLHGSDAQVTIVAWIKRGSKLPSTECEAVAGMWDETRRKRQYCLFLNLGIWDSQDNVGGHVSSIGGPTPGYRYCMDAAIGSARVPLDVWQTVAFSYDGMFARAYLNGRLDLRGGRNPYCYPGGLFNGGDSGADFTVGAVHRGGEMGNFFTGVLGGLAVYRRALTGEELLRLAAVVS